MVTITMSTQIPRFLLPHGLPNTQTLQTLNRTRSRIHISSRTFSSTSPASASKGRSGKSSNDKHRTLGQPDKFRPPSHPARLVNPARTSPSGQPVNYGPRLTAVEREAQKKKQYPNMFPPEGTVMFKFLTNRWIHIWIAMVCFSYTKLLLYRHFSIVSASDSVLALDNFNPHS